MHSKTVTAGGGHPLSHAPTIFRSVRFAPSSSGEETHLFRLFTGPRLFGKCEKSNNFVTLA